MTTPSSMSPDPADDSAPDQLADGNLAAAGLSRDHALARDADDPLAHCRDMFTLPDDVIYLDGNSLGPLPKGVAARVAATVDTEWGKGLIRSWNAAGWANMPRSTGAKLARLIGADSDNVVVADSTSVPGP